MTLGGVSTTSLDLASSGRPGSNEIAGVIRIMCALLFSSVAVFMRVETQVSAEAGLRFLLV